MNSRVPRQLYEKCHSVAEIAGKLNPPKIYNFKRNILKYLGSPSEEKLLIVTADDFGMCRSVNTAVIKALEAGIITSCELIPVSDASHEAISFCKNHPEVDLGIHLTLTGEFDNLPYEPISAINKVSSLVDGRGCFLKDGEAFRLKADDNEVLFELSAQIEYVLEMGLKPTHLSSHMFILNCFNKDLAKSYRMIMELSKKYNLPFRAPLNALTAGYKKQGYLILDNLIWESYYISEDEKKDFYLKALRNLRPGINEIIIHCGVDDDELKSATGWWKRYVIDCDIFCSFFIRQEIERLGIKLTNWRSLKNEQKLCHFAL